MKRETGIMMRGRGQIRCLHDNRTLLLQANGDTLSDIGRKRMTLHSSKSLFIQ